MGPAGIRQRSFILQISFALPIFFLSLSQCTASTLLNSTVYRDRLPHARAGGRILGSRIIGGSDAVVGEFPWQVSLQRPQFGIPAPDKFCGGVIYDPTTIITAAHCFWDFYDDMPVPSNDVIVVAGVVDIENLDGSQQSIPVLSHRIYDLFNPDTMDYDIAVLTLRTPLQFGTRVNSIPIATSGTVPMGKCVAVGWGETEDVGTPPGELLQKVELDIVDPVTCNALWAPHQTSVTDRMICGHSPNKGTCNGDSGSGFICKNGSTYYLAGVVSWGQSQVSCVHDPKLPSVFTNIAKFTSWIGSAAAQFP